MILLSTGHSKKDPGAIACDGTKEFILNNHMVSSMVVLDPKLYKIIDEKCEDFGYPKHLMCTVKTINNYDKDAMACIEIHHNSSLNQDIRGASVLYWDTSIEGKKLAKAIAIALTNLGNVIYDGFRHYWKATQKNYYQAGAISTLRHVKRRLYYLEKTTLPAVIVEIGYISNKWELQFIKQFRIQIAQTINDGVTDWLGEYTL